MVVSAVRKEFMGHRREGWNAKPGRGPQEYMPLNACRSSSCTRPPTARSWWADIVSGIAKWPTPSPSVRSMIAERMEEACSGVRGMDPTAWMTPSSNACRSVNSSSMSKGCASVGRFGLRGWRHDGQVLRCDTNIKVCQSTVIYLEIMVTVWEKPRTPCSLNQFTILGKQLESNVRSLHAGTQLLPAVYVATAWQLGDTQQVNRRRRAVHSKCHFFLRDNRAEWVETYWAVGIWRVRDQRCALSDGLTHASERDLPISLRAMRSFSVSFGRVEMKLSTALRGVVWVSTSRIWGIKYILS